jgi:hypothetical protein
VAPVAKRDLDELRIGSEPESPSDAGISETLPPLSRTVRGSERWRTIMARGTAPMLAWFALGLVVFGSPRDADYDLQLIAAESAQPNENLPMRALLYENLRSVEGPQLAARALDVQLEDRSGVVRARGKLAPARAGYSDLEGSLQIPADLRGDYRLHAIAQRDTVRVEVERPLKIGEAARYSVEGRPLRALQQFSEGPLQPEPGQIAPDVLRVRVGGGVCVPEEECRIFVHVGSPGANVWIEGNSTVTPLQGPAPPTAETTEGVVALSIITHGPEAQLWLRASRAGTQVAHRSVRLPVALGAVALRLKAAVVREGKPLSVELLGGEGGCIIDVFRDGQWVRTTSAPSCTHPQPIAALPPGVYRVQARRDPFSSATAGVAIAQVVSRSDHAFQSKTSLAVQAVSIDGDRLAKDTLKRAGEVDPALGHDDSDPVQSAEFSYFAAILESGVIELPRAESGYAATLGRLAKTQAQLKWLSILALVLGAISLALAVGRSGLKAAARADAILLEAGQTGPVRRRARARSMLSLALSVFSLMLVFVVLGAYVVARGGP